MVILTKVFFAVYLNTIVITPRVNDIIGQAQLTVLQYSDIINKKLAQTNIIGSSVSKSVL